MTPTPRTPRALAQLVLASVDRALAVQFLRHELQQMGPEAAVAIVEAWAEDAHRGSEAARRARLDATMALADAPALREQMARVAMVRGLERLARELVAEPGRGVDAPQVVPDFGYGRTLSLGERKSLARRRDRQLIARVLRDPHPDVIRILLGNPALVEADVVRLCARRPLAGEVVREVVRAPRWMVREAVRNAIVRNPFSPLDVALSLVPHLGLRDAADVAESPELAESLRAACRERLVDRVRLAERGLAAADLRLEEP